MKTSIVAPVRLIIVDDHKIYLKSLEITLSSLPNISIVKTFSSDEGVMEYLSVEKVDLIIMDIQLEKTNGIELTKMIKTAYPKVMVVVVTMMNDELTRKLAAESGADAFVSKGDEIEKLISSISILTNSDSLSPLHLINSTSKEEKFKVLHGLTKREFQILQSLVEGKTNEEISTDYYISPLTVKTHRSSILRKLKSKNVVQLVALWHKY
jgi:DNA-binding NarL/FixJ family response regulator